MESNPVCFVGSLFLIYNVSLRPLFCARAEHAAALNYGDFVPIHRPLLFPSPVSVNLTMKKKDENLDKKANLLQFIFIV